MNPSHNLSSYHFTCFIQRRLILFKNLYIILLPSQMFVSSLKYLYYSEIQISQWPFNPSLDHGSMTRFIPSKHLVFITIQRGSNPLLMSTLFWHFLLFFTYIDDKTDLVGWLFIHQIISEFNINHVRITYYTFHYWQMVYHLISQHHLIAMLLVHNNILSPVIPMVPREIERNYY